MKKASTLMIQGTASAVGKSVIVTALCRIFKQEGCHVAPFKSQNIALNSFVTEGGGEIGRAQAVQAEAAGIAATVDMNPVLLKPTSNSGCQVIVLGKVDRTVSADDYSNYAPSLLKTVTDSLNRLRQEYDIVVIEGAGSPAEVNLQEREIVNMRIAKASGTPVLLVGDIDKGGVFASLVGTLALLNEDERYYVKGLIINKFRGDVNLLKPALDDIETRTGLPVLGVIPYFKDVRIAQEDSVYLDERKEPQNNGDLDIAIVRLPHTANFDEFDSLEADGCNVRYINEPSELNNPHLIILPGTKSTTNDAHYLHQSGLADIIRKKAKAGMPIVGICGGYQILGKRILDPHKVESGETEVAGLGLLNTVTEFSRQKTNRQVKAVVLRETGLLAGTSGCEINGYEIHMGQTSVEDKSSPFRVIQTPQGKADYLDGAIDATGMILGTYLHGFFHNDDFRRVFLNNLRRYWGLRENNESNVIDKNQEYDKLAALVRQNLNLDRIYRIMEAGI
jgi:adenosylcobyric acid synthase